MASGIRQPAVAGMFYPAHKNELSLTLNNILKKTKKVITEDKKIKALVVPHAGYLYSAQTAAWGYRQLSKKLSDPHFVLIGPSHHYGFSGLAVSSAHFWQTPLGQVKHLAASASNENIMVYDQPHLPEHCLEVQLPFLQLLYQKLSISCFLTGQSLDFQKTSEWFLKHYQKSTFLFSSDLSHYQPFFQAEKKDKKTIEALLHLDGQYFLQEDNTVCGAIGILLLLTIAKKENWQRKVVYYDTSFTASADPANVVGYASIAFYV